MRRWEEAFSSCIMASPPQKANLFEKSHCDKHVRREKHWQTRWCSSVIIDGLTVWWVLNSSESDCRAHWASIDTQWQVYLQVCPHLHAGGTSLSGLEKYNHFIELMTIQFFIQTFSRPICFEKKVKMQQWASFLKQTFLRNMEYSILWRNAYHLPHFMAEV